MTQPALYLAERQLKLAGDREQLMWFWLLVWGYSQVYKKNIFTGKKHD